MINILSAAAMVLLLGLLWSMVRFDYNFYEEDNDDVH